MFRMTGSETDSPEAMERSREGSVCTLGVSEGQCPKNHVSQRLKSHCYSECGGGLREVASLSVLSTVASVFAGLALLASSLAVAATVLFCKYRFEPHLQRICLYVAHVNIVQTGRASVLCEDNAPSFSILLTRTRSTELLMIMANCLNCPLWLPPIKIFCFSSSFVYKLCGSLQVISGRWNINCK